MTTGTRGSQDIVEIPSHVFERFASEPEVISLLVKHSSTWKHRAVQNALPSAVLASAVTSKRQFSAIKLQSQVVMAALDQYVHGERFLEESGPLERRIAAVGEKHSLLHFGERYQPLLRFQHLVTYGGMYYCYLFAQCISASIWEGELKSNFLSKTTMKERNLLGRRLLEPGGAMEPVDYVSGLWEHSSNPLVTAGNGGHYPKSAALLRYLGIKT
jgi:intermediate peptidase